MRQQPESAAMIPDEYHDYAAEQERQVVRRSTLGSGCCQMCGRPDYHGGEECNASQLEQLGEAVIDLGPYIVAQLAADTAAWFLRLGLGGLLRRV